MRQRLTQNFWADEFWCKHCRKLQLHPNFIETLQIAREDFNEPMHPTSGCRCWNYNQEIKGHEKSLHICDAPQHPGQKGTLAVDLACPAGDYRGRLFSCLWSHGFSLGWNAKRGFLHGDLRILVGLPQTTFDY